MSAVWSIFATAAIVGTCGMFCGWIVGVNTGARRARAAEPAATTPDQAAWDVTFAAIECQALVAWLADHYGATTAEITEAGFAAHDLFKLWERGAVRPIARLQGVPEARQRWHVVGFVGATPEVNAAALADVAAVEAPDAARLDPVFDSCLLGLGNYGETVRDDAPRQGFYVYDLVRVIAAIMRRDDCDHATAIERLRFGHLEALRDAGLRLPVFVYDVHAIAAGANNKRKGQ